MNYLFDFGLLNQKFLTIALIFARPTILTWSTQNNYLTTKTTTSTLCLSDSKVSLTKDSFVSDSNLEFPNSQLPGFPVIVNIYQFVPSPPPPTPTMGDLSKITAAANITESSIHESIDSLASIRDKFEDLTLVDTAAFFTDKLITLYQNDTDGEDDNNTKREAYRMAKLLHEKEEYHRAAHFIISRNIHKSDLSCRYLAAKCYVSVLIKLFNLIKNIIFCFCFTVWL